MTRRPIPSDDAWWSSSTSPSRTRTDASRVRSAYASASAAPALRASVTSSSQVSSSFMRRCPDGDVVDAHRRQSHADGHRLPVLAAGAEAGIVRGVGADGADVFQRLGSDADQHRALDGLGDLSPFDQIRLADLEDEVSVRDVHLAAAELATIQSPLDSRDDLLGRLIARREIGIGHARQRRVPEALPPAGAGAALAGELGVQVIIEVTLEHPVLDQDLALAGVALVVDVDRPAASRDGAVVDHRDELARHLFAELAGEERGPLADEIGLQAVSHRFVEEDAAPPWREHNRLRARGRWHGAERGHRLPRGLAAHLLGREILEEAEVDAAASAVEAGAPFAVLAEGDALDREAAEILPVFGEVTERIGDEDLARLVRVAAGDLLHAPVVGARGRVGLLQ